MRRLLVLTVFLGLVSLVGFTPSAEALPQQEIETIYWAEDGSKTEVGGEIRFCNGFRYEYGLQTAFRSKEKGQSCASNAPEWCVMCFQGATRISCFAAEFDTFSAPSCPGEPSP